MSGGTGEQRKLIDSFLCKEAGHVHLVGICGVGMAGLALLLKKRGFAVTGCDASPGRIGGWLESHGVEVLAGHDPEHLSSGVDWMIMTPAVDPSEPEIRRARELSIALFARGAVLPRLLDGYRSIAVAGTHGKTTTAIFVKALLEGAGRDPSWCIGGEEVAVDGVAGVGRGDVIVVEADESDGTLEAYAPDIAVVTNIEYDHMEHFDDKKSFESCFSRFAGQARSRVVFCNDDPRARMICGKLPNAVSYGLSHGSRVTALDLVEEAGSSSFELRCDGASFGRVHLPVPGRHNVLNALAATAAVYEIGLRADEVRDGLSRVSLPKRRFERAAEAEGILVISDYAHHPSEISALMETAAGLKPKRLLVVFQPHRYTRTRALAGDFPAAFRGADEVLLLPVYAASEKPLAGGTTWDLYRRFRQGSQRVCVAGNLREAWEYLRVHLRSGDLLLVVGAGDVVEIAGWAGEELDKPAGWDPAEAVKDLEGRLSATELRLDEPLAPKTSLKVGGSADLWAQVGSVGDLSSLLGWTEENQVPVTVIGRGANVVVGDLGIRGVTVRLEGEFRSLRQEGGVVIAGAALNSRHFLNALQEKGFSGMEFLEGVPGTIGGMLNMNAGAWGSEILDHVLWIRCLNRDGTPCILQSDELEYGYRRCDSIAGRIVVDAGFRLARGNPRDIAGRRRTCSEKRRWMSELRCCGSIFKNPGRDYAGQLIEQAGLKGARAGGALVSDRHANVIVTESGAVAADVHALIREIRSGVMAHAGVILELEVVLL